MSNLDAAALHSEPAASTEPGSLGRRILDTFFAPGELFARFGATPPWVDVLLISAVLATLAMALIPGEVLLNMAREAIAQMEPAQRRAMKPETMANISRYTGPIGVFIGTFLSAFLLAGVLKLVFGVMMKGEATFAQYRAVMSHAALISALGTLATLPVWIMTGDMTTQLSAALLAPDLPKGLVSTLLASLNVFYIWWLAVVAVGVSVVNRRISVVTAGAGIFGIYFAIAAVAGLFAGG
ncbi:MAG: YIP1 family protein [Gemmatimonadetes bacterium]|nr:YIP1 family protein [Gemmatimonadota bacterium]